MELAELRRLVEQCGLQCLEGQDSNLLAVLEFNGEKVPLVMACEVEGMVVKIRTFEMLSAPHSSYRRLLLAALMEANYRVKLVKFGFDADDGEVSACIDLPLSGASLTRKQVDRCLRQLRRTLSTHLPRLREIVNTGRDPGPPGAPALDRDDLTELLEDAIRTRHGKEVAPPEPSDPQNSRSRDLSPPDIDAILRDLLKDD